MVIQTLYTWYMLWYMNYIHKIIWPKMFSTQRQVRLFYPIGTWTALSYSLTLSNEWILWGYFSSRWLIRLYVFAIRYMGLVITFLVISVHLVGQNIQSYYDLQLWKYDVCFQKLIKYFMKMIFVKIEISWILNWTLQQNY